MERAMQLWTSTRCSAEERWRHASIVLGIPCAILISFLGLYFFLS
jgi:hypothetical protein